MDTLLRRRMMLAGGDEPIPLPYTPVDYIQTDGDCYITTGIAAAPPLSSDLKVLMGSNTACSLLAGWIASSGTDSKQFALARYNAYKYATYSYYSNYGSSDVSTSVSYSIDNNKPFIVKTALKNRAQRISVKQENSGGWTTTTKSSTNSVSSTYGLVIFGAYKGGAYSELAPSGTRIYYCKIYSDASFTTLVFDGIPCLYNGEYGLWDRVSNAFFGNSNSTGTFSGGNETYSYTTVSYIQSDGTAFIDTGINGSAPKSARIMLAPVLASSFCYHLGARNGSNRFAPVTQWNASGTAYDNYIAQSYASNNLQGMSMSTALTNSTPLIAKAILEKDLQSLSISQDSGSTWNDITSTTSDEVAMGLHMYIGACNNDGTANRVAPSGTKYHYVKIYSDDSFTNLVFDGVPCICNNEYGLWDNVRNVFFGNAAGSGSFSGPSNA